MSICNKDANDAPYASWILGLFCHNADHTISHYDCLGDLYSALSSVLAKTLASLYHMYLVSMFA